MFAQVIHRVIHRLCTYPHAPRTHGEPLWAAFVSAYGVPLGTCRSSLLEPLRRLAHSLQVGYFATQHGPYLARYGLLQSNNLLRRLAHIVLRAPARARYVYCVGCKRCCDAMWHAICYSRARIPNANDSHSDPLGEGHPPSLATPRGESALRIDENPLESR